MASYGNKSNILSDIESRFRRGHSTFYSGAGRASRNSTEPPYPPMSRAPAHHSHWPKSKTSNNQQLPFTAQPSNEYSPKSQTTDSQQLPFTAQPANEYMPKSQITNNQQLPFTTQSTNEYTPKSYTSSNQQLPFQGQPSNEHTPSASKQSLVESAPPRQTPPSNSKYQLPRVGCIIIVAIVILILIALAVIIPLVIVKDDGQGKTYNTTEIELQTFNVALQNTILGTDKVNRTTRRERIVEAIKESSADVLCLQEVYYEMDLRYIIEAVKDTFEYSFSFLHQGGEIPIDFQEVENACGENGEQALAFIDCANTTCMPLLTGPDQLPVYFRCIFAQCSPLNFTSPRCLECYLPPCFDLVTDLSAGKVCIEKNYMDGTCNTQITNGNLTRTRGLLLFSKNKIKSASTSVFSYLTGAQTLDHRGFLQAEIDGVGTVLCNHMTTDLISFLDFTSGLSSYLEMNQWEMKNVFNDTANNIEGELFVLGDFNNGPDIPEKNVVGEFATSFDLANSLGFESVLMKDGTNVQCSFCATNGFASAGSTNITTGIDFLLDHIFMRNDSQQQVKRTKVLINTMDEGSEPVQGDISDHYGVSVVLSNSIQPLHLNQTEE